MTSPETCHERRKPALLPSRRLLVTGAMLYCILSFADWWLTWHLVGDGSAHEANPLAAAVLRDFGWAGLAVFKAVLVGVVLGVGAFLWTRRPRAARLLLGLACSAVGVVVAYSVLLCSGTAEAREWHQRLTTAQNETARLQRYHSGQKLFHERLRQLAREIVEGKTSLTRATAQLDAYLDEVEHDPVPFLGGLYGTSGRNACLAAHLVRHVGFHVSKNPELASRQLEALSEEFSIYEVSLPELARESFAPQGSVSLWRPRTGSRSHGGGTDVAPSR